LRLLTVMRIVYFFVFYFFIFNLLATPKVSIYDPDTDDEKKEQRVYTSVSDNDGDHQALTVIVSSSAGSSSSAPVEVFIPINEHSADYGDEDRADYTALSQPEQMPNFSTGGHVHLTLTVLNDAGADRYFRALVKNDTNYVPFELHSHVDATIDNDEHNRLYDIDFSLDSGDAGAICNISPQCEVRNGTQYKDVYFVLASSLDTEYSASELPANGVYFRFRFSNQLNAATVTLTDLQAYDEQLKLIYSGPLVTNFYKTFLYRYDDTSSEGSGTTQFSTIGAGEIVSYHSANTSGAIFIRNLINDTDYNFALGFIDKYQFVNGVSNSKIARPENIEEFLNKKACFFLSAGFKQDHYVLEYFRKFRDESLLTNSLGQRFVSWYYSFAPHYAKIIWDSPFLSFLVRALGFVAYFFSRFFIGIVIAGFLIISIYNVYRRRRLHSTF